MIVFINLLNKSNSSYLKGNERPRLAKSAWGELPQRPQEQHENNRQSRPFDNQRPDNRAAWNMQQPPINQARVSPGQYPPLSGPQQPGQDGSPTRQTNQDGSSSKKEQEPSDDWTQKRQKQQEEMHAAVERARKRREQEELDFQAKTKAAAMVKLKAIEEKGKPSDDEKKENVIESMQSTDKKELKKPEPHKEQDGEPSNEPKTIMARPDDLSRRRTDSDSSDASRSSGSRQFHHQQRNIPPRFQQQRQQQQQQYHQQQLYQATQHTGSYTHVHEPTRQIFDAGM